MPRSDREPEGRQLDLFDGPASCPQMPAAAPVAAPIPPSDIASLSDLELLAGFADATMADVSAIGKEILRRRTEGWSQAALGLWDRFLGFGTAKPMLEQVVVLNLVRIRPVSARFQVFSACQFQGMSSSMRLIL